MIKLFNTSFESSLHVLLLLEFEQIPRELEWLVIFDTICIYGKDYGIAKDNLNGDSPFRKCEYSARRLNFKRAMKRLICEGLVEPILTYASIQYKISDYGIQVIHDIDIEYANEYRKSLEMALNKYNLREIKELLNLVCK